MTTLRSDDLTLVTGATGQVGRLVVQGLLSAGARVRASSRRPAAAASSTQLEHVQADLNVPDSLPAALRGVRRAFLYVQPGGIAGFIQAAKLAGVEHVVLLSSASVDEPGLADNAIGQMHAAVEAPLMASGLSWTFLRPGAFASNALRWAPALRAGLLLLPYPEAHGTPIHEHDIADVAVRALLEPGHRERAYTLSGPESLTQRQQAEILARVVGRPLRIERISPEEWSKLDAGLPPHVQRSLLGYWSHYDGRPIPVVETVQQLTGHAPRTFEAWAREHVAAFAS